MNPPLGAMPGNVLEVSTRCGNANCKCSRKEKPEKHKFFQLSYSSNGKTKTLHIKRKDLQTVKDLTENYKTMRKASLTLGDEFAELVKDKGVTKACQTFKQAFSKATKVGFSKENKKLEKELSKTNKSLEDIKAQKKEQSKSLHLLNRKLLDTENSKENFKKKYNNCRSEKLEIKKMQQDTEKKNKKLEKEKEEINRECLLLKKSKDSRRVKEKT